jgi:hypothetical protein
MACTALRPLLLSWTLEVVVVVGYVAMQRATQKSILVIVARCGLKTLIEPILLREMLEPSRGLCDGGPEDQQQDDRKRRDDKWTRGHCNIKKTWC